ncbi:MAG: 3-deoxy-7-phosphoheptulonate synthase [Bacilli bacterium]|nr:3-deoxy-7-phosphoheptulonate synthase [Bacilli bacterium]
MEENKIICNSVVNIKGLKIGENQPLVFMAGPCTVESIEQVKDLENKVKNAGAHIFRGGAFKPRTSPYSFQGLGYEGLNILKQVNMPVISEITAIEQIPAFLETVDIIQVGARNMHNYELLKALGKINKPILLKRGFDSTIEEWLCAAEYILLGGNKDVILCERGIRTFDNKARFTLDIAAITYVKRISKFPLIVDPSHAAGKSFLVKDLALAAVAAGADGLLIEVSDTPDSSISDKEQAITPHELKEIIDKAKEIKKVL